MSPTLSPARRLGRSPASGSRHRRACPHRRIRTGERLSSPQPCCLSLFFGHTRPRTSLLKLLVRRSVAVILPEATMSSRSQHVRSFWRVAPCSLIVVATLGATVLAQTDAPPQSKPDVAVNLVLAVDTSGSVSADRFELQKQGYAAAFRSPKLFNLIRSLETQSIAVTMMQWTGPRLHVVVVDWMLIKDEQSADALAGAIEAAPRQLFGGGTSISGAIDYSRLLLAQCPFNAVRRVIDISGDGSNNSGRPVTQARDEAVKDGVGINGLPILSIEPLLDRYYYDNVIGGPGAFMIPAENYDTFADAVLKKLITEIAAAGDDAIRSRSSDSTAPAASQTRPTSPGKSPPTPQWPR